jgi:hypothetical protein
MWLVCMQMTHNQRDGARKRYRSGTNRHGQGRVKTEVKREGSTPGGSHRSRTSHGEQDRAQGPPAWAATQTREELEQRHLREQESLARNMKEAEERKQKEVEKAEAQEQRALNHEDGRMARTSSHSGPMAVHPAVYKARFILAGGAMWKDLDRATIHGPIRNEASSEVREEIREVGCRTLETMTKMHNDKALRDLPSGSSTAEKESSCQERAALEGLHRM